MGLQIQKKAKEEQWDDLKRRNPRVHSELPVGINLLGIVFMFSGILVIIMGVLMTVSPFIPSLIPDQIIKDEFKEYFHEFRPIALILTIAGVIYALSGYGLRRLNLVAWIMMLFFTGATALDVLLNLDIQFFQVTIFHPLFTILVFFYLVLQYKHFRFPF